MAQAPREHNRPFVVAYVIGVTPGKWARTWSERMPRHPLTLTQLSQQQAVAALHSGEAHVALLRLPLTEELEREAAAIPLYTEAVVVVAPKDHPVAAFEAVSRTDLVGETMLDTAGEIEWPGAVELVAANVGLAIMPQPVARALGRRDVVARILTNEEGPQIALVWLTASESPEIDEFVGIVRGRTANSSRGRG